jgi:hypothetical protein
MWRLTLVYYLRHRSPGVRVGLPLDQARAKAMAGDVSEIGGRAQLGLARVDERILETTSSALLVA